MSCCTRQQLWRSIAVFSMVLSLILTGASICGLLTYYCMMNPGVSKFQMDNTYFTYVLYFYSQPDNLLLMCADHDCVDTSSDYIVWNSALSDRTWAWVIAYLAINFVWFVTSLMLLNAPNYWKTATALWLTYPWLLVTFGVICTDIAASVFYGLDYSYIETIDKLFNYIMISYPNKSANPIDYQPVPTILMVGIFSKAILGWILVCLSFITIYVLLVRVGKPESLILQTRAPFDYYTPSTGINPAFQNEMVNIRNTMDSAQPASGSTNGTNIGSRFEDNWSSSELMHVPKILPRVQTRYDGYAAQRPWSYLPANHDSAHVKSAPVVKFAVPPSSSYPTASTSNNYYHDNAGFTSDGSYI